MREEIRELEKMGPLPSFEAAAQPGIVEKIQRYTELLCSIDKPITDDEARTLARLFSPDDCFELDWTLVHLVETAPGWPIWECLEITENKWIHLLRLRLKNAGIVPH
jgi:hypothetical protein